MSEVVDNQISGLARMRENMPDQDWQIFLRLAAHNSELRKERGKEDEPSPRETEEPAEPGPDTV